MCYSFRFVDKPKFPRKQDDKFWEDFRKEQDVINRRFKEEFGIE